MICGISSAENLDGENTSAQGFSVPQIISLIDHRHIAYNQNLQEVFALERAGKAFVFAPSHPIHVGTYSMNEQLERDLYALGMEDFSKQQDALAAFMTE